MSYEVAKECLVSALLHDEVAHREGHYDEIGAHFDEVEGGFSSLLEPENHKLFVVLSFWDGWIDARNHDWDYHEPITKADWPNLARQIVNDLNTDSELTNPIVIEKFDFAIPPFRPNIWQRLKRSLRRELSAHRNPSILPPQLQTDLDCLSAALETDKDVPVHLSSYLSGINKLPVSAFMRAADDIRRTAGLDHMWDTAGVFHHRKSLLLKYPQLCCLFIFHGDGRLRELSLKHWREPPNSPFALIAVAYRLNDWAEEVRIAAHECGQKLFPLTSADVVADASLFLFRQLQQYRRLETTGNQLLNSTLYRHDVMQALAGKLMHRPPGQVSTIFRYVLNQPGLDEFLPMLAREAALPHVRAIAYDALIKKRSIWLVRYQFEWIDKRYSLRRRIPQFEQRTIDHNLDIETLIAEAAKDKAVVVRKVAARGLIDLRHELSTDMVLVGELLSKDKAASVRSRAEFYLNNLPRN